ncbi:MAG: hypothetical protein K0B09_14830 [Bacteroidales bacterium]|nr:hypothetical protein [Bacteroidales bacterium]
MKKKLFTFLMITLAVSGLHAHGLQTKFIPAAVPLTFRDRFFYETIKNLF